jgi:hypothetical protein
MTTFSMRYIKGHFVVTGSDVLPMQFKSAASVETEGQFRHSFRWTFVIAALCMPVDGKRRTLTSDYDNLRHRPLPQVVLNTSTLAHRCRRGGVHPIIIAQPRPSPGQARSMSRLRRMIEPDPLRTLARSGANSSCLDSEQFRAAFDRWKLPFHRGRKT